MSQVMPLPSRSGWNPEETAQLWQEVRACNSSGQPLRAAFERMAARTGRKSNSIRNYYYAAVKAGDVPGDVSTARALPFTPFSSDEIDELLRQVLTAQGSGVSVRACVTALSGGDRSLALRLQNKYRALLKSHPDRVLAVCRELEAEGKPCVDPFRKMRSLPRDAALRTCPPDAIVRQIAARADALPESIARPYLAICLRLAELLSDVR